MSDLKVCLTVDSKIAIAATGKVFVGVVESMTDRHFFVKVERSDTSPLGVVLGFKNEPSTEE